MTFRACPPRSPWRGAASLSMATCGACGQDGLRIKKWWPTDLGPMRKATNDPPGFPKRAGISEGSLSGVQVGGPESLNLQ
eukprot:5857449-Heterocapsa_arctica.AAC.1